MSIRYKHDVELDDILKRENNTGNYYLIFQLADPLINVSRTSVQHTTNYGSKLSSKICYYSLHVNLEKYKDAKPILDNKLDVLKYKMREPIIYIKTKIIDSDKNRKLFQDALF